MFCHMASFSGVDGTLVANLVRKAVVNRNMARLDLHSGTPQCSFERLQCCFADVMLDSFRIAFRCLFVDPEAAKKRNDDPVALSTGLRQFLPGLGEEYRAIWFPPNKASGLEPRNVLGHSWRFHAKSFCYLDRSGLSARLDQFRDQLDVVLGHFALVRLTHGRKPVGLCFGSPVDSFKWFTPM